MNVIVEGKATVYNYSRIIMDDQEEEEFDYDEDPVLDPVQQSPIAKPLLEELSKRILDHQPTREETKKWNDEERRIALDAFDKYGKEYAMISGMLGTKTEDQVRNFYNK